MASDTGVPIDAHFTHCYDDFVLDVDLALPAKGVTVLYGQSGSGKTTLLRCLAGLVHAPGGVLSVDGEQWQGDEVSFISRVESASSCVGRYRICRIGLLHPTSF